MEKYGFNILKILLSAVIVFGTVFIMTACGSKDTDTWVSSTLKNDKESSGTLSVATQKLNPDEVNKLVLSCLAKADELQKVYIGECVETDEEQLPDGFVKDEYSHVSDERINTPELFYEYFRTVFAGETADKIVADLLNTFFYKIKDNKVYKSNKISPTALTVGKWHTEKMTIVKNTDSEIEVKMQTKINNSDNGIKALKLLKVDDKWLLTESYILK